MRRVCLFGCFIFLAAHPAPAQVCAGGASFREHKVQLSVAPTFSDAATGVSGAIGFGGAEEFGAIGVGVSAYDALDSSATAISFLIGSDIAVDKPRKVFICPVFEAAFQSGPDVDFVDIALMTFAGSGQVGFLAFEADRLNVITTFGLGVIHERAKASAFGFSETASDTYGAVKVGLGLVFSTMFIRPSMAIPLGLDGSDPTFGIVVGFAF